MTENTSVETTPESSFTLNPKAKKAAKWAAVGMLAFGALLIVDDTVKKFKRGSSEETTED